MNYLKFPLKKETLFHFLLVLLFISKTDFVNGQSSLNEKKYYEKFDNEIGKENTGIYNGIIYKEKFRTINRNHEFYLTSKFISGNIIYNKQPYFNIEMKYDIYEDLVIVKLPSNSEYFFVQLINNKIDKFFINNCQFIKMSKKKEELFNEILNGFYEIVYQDLILLFL